MKKIFFIAILSLVSMFSVAAPATDVTTSTEKSSVTARISGVDEDIDFDTIDIGGNLQSHAPEGEETLCEQLQVNSSAN